MNKKVCVIGDGGWGTAIGMLLHSNGYSITMWGPFEDYLKEVREKHENTRYLPGVTIPSDFVWESIPEKAVEGATTIVLAVPSHFYESVCQRFAGLIKSDVDVVSVSKGFCEATRKRLSETAAKVLGINDVVALSGPSHAEEVSRGIPTAVVAASKCIERAKRIQEIFTGKLFRVYTSNDPLGVELGGAVKNVIALAVGMSDGLGFGDNSRAALITRGLAEMTRLGTALGGKPETFAGLSGVGDIVVTCTSRHSRNRSVGERLGKGESIQDIQASMKQVAEGVWNCDIVVELAHCHNIEMPICETVQSVLKGEIAPRDAVAMLMARDMKSEHLFN